METDVKRRFRTVMAIAACVLVTIAGFANGADACSQCMCGTPFPAGVLGRVVPTQVTYGIEDRYLSKTSGLDDGPGEQQELEHRVAGIAAWRPSDHLALLGRLPYDIKQVIEPAGQARQGTRASRGVGDAELTALVGLARGSCKGG